MSKEVLDVLLEIAKAVAIVTIPIIARRLDAYLIAKEAEAQTNKKNSEFNATYQKILGIIRASVDTTNQTFVDELKATDSFDETAWCEAYQKTYSAIMKQLDNSMRDFINVAYGDMNVFIRNQVESYIRERK